VALPRKKCPASPTPLALVSVGRDSFFFLDHVGRPGGFNASFSPPRFRLRRQAPNPSCFSFPFSGRRSSLLVFSPDGVSSGLADVGFFATIPLAHSLFPPFRSSPRTTCSPLLMKLSLATSGDSVGPLPLRLRGACSGPISPASAGQWPTALVFWRKGRRFTCHLPLFVLVRA